MSKQLSIWWGSKVAGFLHLNDYGDMGFSYAPEWLEDADAPALSFSLPKQVEPFSSRKRWHRPKIAKDAYGRWGQRSDRCLIS